MSLGCGYLGSLSGPSESRAPASRVIEAREGAANQSSGFGGSYWKYLLLAISSLDFRLEEEKAK